MGWIIGIDLSGIGPRAAVLRDGRVETIPSSISEPMSAARLLAALKSQAERYLGEPEDGAVIAVSAMLNEVQRERIRVAAGEAGLHRCRLIAAPAAAALHYAWEHGGPAGKYLAVHAGATEIDMAVMQLGDKVVEVLAVDGTDRWGAAVSDGVTAAMEADLRRMIRDTLHEAGVDRNELAGLIPSGDEQCIFALMDMLRDAAGRHPVTGTEPEESAVFGAAIQGGVLSGDVESILLLDAAAHSLWVRFYDEKCEKLIARGTTFPTKKTTVLTTSKDGQTELNLHLYQGESEDYRNDTFVGAYKVHGVPPLPVGEARVEISVGIDANGVITVTARDVKGDKDKALTVTKRNGPDPGPREPASPEKPVQPPPKPEGDGRLEAVLKLLPVYDSLCRAVQYETDQAKRQGSEAILKQYRTILADMGVTAIKTVGRTFDPRLHDAQSHVTDPRYGPNVIVRELEAGFMMDGKVIRFAKVQVAN